MIKQRKPNPKHLKVRQGSQSLDPKHSKENQQNPKPSPRHLRSEAVRKKRGLNPHARAALAGGALLIAIVSLSAVSATTPALPRTAVVMGTSAVTARPAPPPTITTTTATPPPSTIEAQPSPTSQPPQQQPDPSGAVPDIIRRVFAPHGQAAVDIALRVAHCESGYNPSAQNPSGASGVFQVMPEWSDEFARVTGQPYYDGRFNPLASALFAAWLAYDASGSSGWSNWVCY